MKRPSIKSEWVRTAVLLVLLCAGLVTIHLQRSGSTNTLAPEQTTQTNPAN